MSTSRRYELSDFEWSIIEPLLPNKPRGVPRSEQQKLSEGHAEGFFVARRKTLTYMIQPGGKRPPCGISFPRGPASLTASQGERYAYYGRAARTSLELSDKVHARVRRMVEIEFAT